MMNKTFDKGFGIGGQLPRMMAFAEGEDGGLGKDWHGCGTMMIRGMI